MESPGCALNGTHQGEQAEQLGGVLAELVVGGAAEVREALELRPRPLGVGLRSGPLALVDDVGHVRGEYKRGAVPVREGAESQDRVREKEREGGSR